MSNGHMILCTKAMTMSKWHCVIELKASARLTPNSEIFNWRFSLKFQLIKLKFNIILMNTNELTMISILRQVFHPIFNQLVVSYKFVGYVFPFTVRCTCISILLYQLIFGLKCSAIQRYFPWKVNCEMTIDDYLVISPKNYELYEHEMWCWIEWP